MIASSDNGLTGTTSTGSRWSRSPAASGRREARRLIGAPSRRRNANAIAAAENRSAQCASSTASRTGASRARARNRPPTATPIALRSGGSPFGSSSSIATRRARRCGSGRALMSSSKPARRSPSAANDSPLSASPGRVTSTRQSRRRADSTPVRQSGLADSWLAFENESGRRQAGAVEECLDSDEFLCSANDAGSIDPFPHDFEDGTTEGLREGLGDRGDLMSIHE